MLEQLKESVYTANMELAKKNLVILTWGNVSGIDQNREVVAIKPSGVEYDKLTPDDIVLVGLDGRVIEGRLNPSSDTPTHLELYKAYAAVGGICHTHSVNASAFAQAFSILVPNGIQAMGTTHADYFNGTIPVTRQLKKREIEHEYEKNTGLVIIEALKKAKRTPSEMPAVLVASHGPFTFGADAAESVYHAEVLETVAEIAIRTYQILVGRMYISSEMQGELLHKHFDRKHGLNAYYGQKKQ